MVGQLDQGHVTTLGVVLGPEPRPPVPNQVCFLHKRCYLKAWQALHYGWLNDWFHSDFEDSGMLHQAQLWAQPEGNALTNLTSFHQQFSALHCSQHCLHFPVTHSVSQELAKASCRQAPLAPCVGPAFLRGPTTMPPYFKALRRPTSHRGPLKPPVIVTMCVVYSACFDQSVPKRKQSLYIYIFKTSQIAQPPIKYLEFTWPLPKTHWRFEWITLSHSEGNIQVLRIKQHFARSEPSLGD